MKQHINKILIASQKIRKEWALCFLLGIGFVVACQGALEEGNPFGPSNSNIVIAQSSPQINKGGTQNFTAVGGTLPLTWSLSATQIGAINAGTGIFTAAAVDPGPQVAGTATITVVDAVGDTDTATITVLPNILAIVPGSSTQQGAGAEEFTAAGAANGVTATISNNNASSVYALPALAIANNQVTVNYLDPATTETLTITISNKENGDVGSVILTVIPQ